VSKPSALLRLMAWLIFWAVAAPGLAATGPQTGGESPDIIQSLQTSLDIIEEGLEGPGVNERDIQDMRRQLEYVADSALRIRARAVQREAEARRLLEALGPKPGETDPGESERVAAERKKLDESVAEYQGRIKSANVILARIDVLRSRMARAELNFLLGVLGERTETPLAPRQIAEAGRHLPSQFERFSNRINEWWKDVEFDRKRFGTLMWWLVLLVCVVILVVPTRNWVLQRYGPDHRDEDPSYLRRFKVMIAVGLGNVVLPVVSVIGLYIVLLKSAGMTEDVRDMASIVVTSLIQYFLITGLSSAAMSPGYPEWRVSRFTNESADSLYRSIRLFAILIAIINMMRIPLTELHGRWEVANILVMDVTLDPLHTVFGAVALILIALSMLDILRQRNWQFVHVDEEGGSTIRPPSRVVQIFFSIAKLGLVVAVAACLAGYVNLGIFLSQRIVRSLLIVALAYLVRALIAAICNQAASAESDIGRILRTRLDYTAEGATRLMFWVMLVVDVVLVSAALIVLLLIWGVHIADIQSSINKLLYGINIGNFTLSLVDIGTALALFVVLFFLVRLFQGFLSNRVLVQTVPDVGVRDALTTGVGYAGVIIAAIIAVSSLGLELSRLAIIFGALSVGIGFGLQHVVNNFISGLILLMHRPIKAGDWIVVGQHEGYVKKINVVATEIQTFDNAEVIVPNSQLVSSEVLNWTHKSTVARVIVSVNVSYDSDPRRVRDVLLRCAHDRDDILNSPAPMVILRNFGDSALVFELRFFIKQADYMLLTASDLRFQITDAFREAGITIPYPQRDIHIRTPGNGGREQQESGQGTTRRTGSATQSRHRDEPPQTPEGDNT
jgi:small-conductance mechanosensitive channel